MRQAACSTLGSWVDHMAVLLCQRLTADGSTPDFCNISLRTAVYIIMLNTAVDSCMIPHVYEYPTRSIQKKIRNFEMEVPVFMLLNIQYLRFISFFKLHIQQ